MTHRFLRNCTFHLFKDFVPPAFLIFAGNGVSAEVGSAVPMRLTPDEISWPTASTKPQAGSSMLDVVQSFVVFGDASKPALYSIMFKVAPNAAIPAHSHPDDRSCFVMSGIWYFGYGNRYNETALRALPPGSHYTEPANLKHFAATKSTQAVVECTSIGPTGTTFAKTDDDPQQ